MPRRTPWHNDDSGDDSSYSSYTAAGSSYVATHIDTYADNGDDSDLSALPSATAAARIAKGRRRQAQYQRKYVNGTYSIELEQYFDCRQRSIAARARERLAAE